MEINEIELKKWKVKTNETKSWFFEKTKISVKTDQRKKENIQINDIIYEKSNITIVKTGLKDNKIKIDKYLEILSFHGTVFAIKDYWEKM